jgi:beta-lactamase class C
LSKAEIMLIQKTRDSIKAVVSVLADQGYDMKLMRLILAACAAATWSMPAAAEPVAGIDPAALKTLVDNTIRPVMATHHIPGLALAVTVDGKRYFYEYGVASKASGQAVTRDTLFEIGSVSKTFTATLAALAQAEGKLSLDDSPARFLPALRGSSVARVSLIHLATYTAGGLPLQVPDGIDTNDQFIDYLTTWQAPHMAGERRLYSNPSIGLLGLAVAQSLQMPFDRAIETRLFPALGMHNSFIHVPAARMSRYAQGYDRQNMPVRVNPGAIDAEAYGVKSGSADMIRFIEANMQAPSVPLTGVMRQALAGTHQGYYQIDGMTQCLVWEQYALPLNPATILAGSTAKMILEANKVESLNPPLAPRADVWIHKTGSTNGFGAYVAYIPARHTGIVILANRNYPNQARIGAALDILNGVRALQAGPGAAASP